MSRRAVGDAGSATVSAYLVLLSFVGGAILWLTRDVDRAVSAGAEADSIAFQAARSAAQQVTPASLRVGRPAIDAGAAAPAAVATADLLLDRNGSVGRVLSVEVSPGGDRVTVVVELTEAGREVAGRGTARLATGVSAEGDR